MIEWLASDFRPIAQDVLAFSTCIAALVWGAGPERAIAVTWLSLFEFAPRVYNAFLREGYQLAQVDGFLAVIDISAGFLMVAIALNANRNYPLFIAAMQLLALAAHVSRGLIEAISPVAYLTMVIAPGWLQLFIFAAGLCRHILRKKRHGDYRAWRVPVMWFGLLPARSGAFKP